MAQGKNDALLDRRISVLEAPHRFIGESETLEEGVSCPSCGQSVVLEGLDRHVRKELEALEQQRILRDVAKEKRSEFRNSLNHVLRLTREASLASWLRQDGNEELVNSINRLATVCAADDENLGEEVIESIREDVSKLLTRFSEETRKTPPSVREILNDLETVKTGLLMPGFWVLEDYYSNILEILEVLTNIEDSLRTEIGERTEKAIDEISGTVQRLWSRLQPGEPIEDVHLYVQNDEDKAVDVALRFHGVDQYSPRMTLSEGHRNYLGICVFLALALKTGSDNPIILDDVVSSLDSEHRGTLTDVIVEEFGEKQTIIFTHNREWYAELRNRLPSASWRFKALLPWINPKIGVQWSPSIYTLDDARILVSSSPEAGGNMARAIMDGELANISEKLRMNMPYLRGDRNDRRTCVDFLNRIVTEAPDRLRKKDGETWLIYTDPIRDWIFAKSLLIAWGNRAASRGNFIQSEAEKLINVCARALNHFKCSKCGDYVWTTDEPGRRRLECSCGDLQWRYG